MDKGEEAQRAHDVGRNSRVLSAARWGVLGAAVALVVVAVALPSTALSWLRRDYEFIGRPLLWLDNTSELLPLDLTHVALFALTGFLVAALWPRARWHHVAAALLALAIGSELLQFLAPGREPRIADVLDDLIGAAIGCSFALPVRWVARRL